jgi:uncharacterized protein DUF6002
VVLESALVYYYDKIQLALRHLFSTRGTSSGNDFEPGPELPALTPAMTEYLSASRMTHSPLPGYQGKELSLLNLAHNPGTRTTKIFPSLIIVARAVRHIQESGERITIITPSSANKATGLRDAVLRAITAGLVKPDQLNIVSIVPAGSAAKLHSSELFTDPLLRARNPVALYHGNIPGDVKAISRAVVDKYGGMLTQQTGARLWYTLALENYAAADVVRALAEAAFFPAAAGRPRLHVQAVSSAFGLLGHAYGQDLFRADLGTAPPAHYLLVQHLGAPDMVLSLYHGGQPGHWRAPEYTYQKSAGVYTQYADPHFPCVTFDPAETLDSTFYTRNPPTSARMNELIHKQGGGGIVVSLAECLQRYGQARALLCEAGMPVPTNPMAVREWSSIMAVVGALNAIDRQLVPEDDILVHGSGAYSVADYEALPARELPSAETDGELQRLVLSAATP